MTVELIRYEFHFGTGKEVTQPLPVQQFKPIIDAVTLVVVLSLTYSGHKYRSKTFLVLSTPKNNAAFAGNALTNVGRRPL